MKKELDPESPMPLFQGSKVMSEEFTIEVIHEDLKTRYYRVVVTTNETPTIEAGAMVVTTTFSAWPQTWRQIVEILQA